MERHYGWVIVAVGALMGCIGMGSMFSLAVFLDPIAADTGWSRAGISASMTVAFLAMGLGAFGWGWVSDELLAADLVERQRAQGANAAHLAARVALSREIVDFLQVEVPAVVTGHPGEAGPRQRLRPVDPGPGRASRG